MGTLLTLEDVRGLYRSIEAPVSGRRSVRDFQKADPHLRGNRKFKRLCAMLSREPNVVHGMLSGLWGWAFTQAPDGDLSKFEPWEIAEEVDWTGDADKLIDSLVACGFVTQTGQIHDWEEWGGSLFQTRKRDAQRQWDRRHQPELSTELSTGNDADGEPVDKHDACTVHESRHAEELQGEMSMDESGQTKCPRTYPRKREKERDLNPPTPQAVENSSSPARVFDEQFWPRWPNRKGSKKLTRSRFVALSGANQAKCLRASGFYAEAMDRGLIEPRWQYRAENFVGGRKSYYEEWADGIPAWALAKAKSRDATSRDRVQVCVRCGKKLSPDELLDAKLVEGEGWAHDRCPE